MSNSPVTAGNARSAWVISPMLDSLFLIGTPVAIVPLVLFASRRFATPEQIDLIVAAFASLAHHLPGFMRCYGDRQLLRRFRWRFVLLPPIFFAVAWVFTWHEFHGLVLILLVWGTWHGLMQTYGFMRIYDLKREMHDRWTGRLDFWLCLSLFALGVVFSEARIYNLMAALWQSGMPAFGPQWLARIRYVVVGVTAAVGLAYLINMVRTSRSTCGISWAKIALAISTGGLYWFSGLLTTNLLVGIAMFEMFHAVQYYAIVWAYNRKSVERSATSLGPFSFLFRDNWAMLGVYLALICAYGSIRLVSSGADSLIIQKLIMTMIATSTLMHFYFDGFIWRVSERSTQENLDIDSQRNTPARIRVSGLRHASKLALLGALCLVLYVSELRQPRQLTESQDQLLANLAQWTPDLPELQTLISRHELARGNTDAAISAGSKAVKLRPRSHAAHAELGASLLAKRRFADAVPVLERAVSLNQRDPAARTNLIAALSSLGRHEEAIAIAYENTRIAGQSPSAWLSWGLALNGAKRFDEALTPLETAITLDESLVEAWHQLGIARLQLGQVDEAANALTSGLDVDTGHAMCHFQLGNIAYLRQDLTSSMRRFRRSIELAPDFPEAHVNLGAVWQELGEPDRAISAYRRALEVNNQHPLAHLNLGLLLLSKYQDEPARFHLKKAEQYGYQLPPELAMFIRE